VRFYCKADDYPYPTEVTVLTSVNCGEFEAPPVTFDNEDAVGGYIAPNFDCLAHLVAVFDWPGGEQCTAEAWITVSF